MVGGISLEVAQQNLNDALAALADARKQQSFAVTGTSGGRSHARALHASLLEEVKFWRQEVARLERGGVTVSYGVASNG